MVLRLFFASVVFCLVCVGLTLVPDPGIFGIREETGRILFYGGSGLLAGFSGLVAAVSGVYITTSGRTTQTAVQHRLTLVVIGLLMAAVVIAALIRLV